MRETTPEEREKIHAELKEKYEYTFDMDNPPPKVHRWVDRGEFLSCEGAGHPCHSHYKQKVRG